MLYKEAIKYNRPDVVYSLLSCGSQQDLSAIKAHDQSNASSRIELKCEVKIQDKNLVVIYTIAYTIFE